MVQIEAPSTPGCQDSIPSQGGQHREEHRVVHRIQEEHYDGHIQWAWVIVTDVHGSGWSPKYSWVSAKSSQVVSERKNMGYQRKLLILSNPLSTVHRRSPNHALHKFNHEPWTKNQGLTLSTIWSSQFLFKKKCFVISKGPKKRFFKMKTSL